MNIYANEFIPSNDLLDRIKETTITIEKFEKNVMRINEWLLFEIENNDPYDKKFEIDVKNTVTYANVENIESAMSDDSFKSVVSDDSYISAKSDISTESYVSTKNDDIKEKNIKKNINEVKENQKKTYSEIVRNK